MRRPAFYALRVGGWRDYVSLLHPPYTVWHLSYVILGSATAPVVHPDRVVGCLLAFFLAVGIAAHALDEAHGRPLQTRIPKATLLTVAGAALAGALAIGVIAVFTISPWALPLVLFGGLIVPSYNLEWVGGRFHSDAWFALSWGAFPAFVGYWANAERVEIPALLVAIACLVLSLAQRVLSTPTRRLRRTATAVSGSITFKDGSVQLLSMPALLEAPERALQLLSVAIPLLAVGWIVSRLAA